MNELRIFLERPFDCLAVVAIAALLAACVCVSEWKERRALRKAKRAAAAGNAISALPIVDAPCVPCPLCEGAKETLCLYPGCGGLGYIAMQVKVCPTCKLAGEVDPECHQCGGDGQLIVQQRDCPCCHGSKKQPCTFCAARGSISAKKQNGYHLQQPESCIQS